MKMSEAGLVGFSVVRISGTIVLMVFQSEEKMKEVASEQGKILDEWFLKKQVWTDSIKMENRRVWLSCYGVPIHVWNILTFQMAGWWGEFISISEETQEPISFMRGNIQLITDCFNGIDEVIDLQMNGSDDRNKGSEARLEYHQSCSDKVANVGMEKCASDINTKLNVDMGICETTYDCENSDGLVGEKILNEGNGNQGDNEWDSGHRQRNWIWMRWALKLLIQMMGMRIVIWEWIYLRIRRSM
ncbi:hypothetical protein Gotur_014452 [Gossypium turneri]